jgi:ligand-binding sensor domain-containing protein
MIEDFLRISLVVFCFPGACLAVDPARPLEELQMTRWDQQNGLLQDSVRAVAQTPDGLLWVASEEGLVRFDGTEFFAPSEFQQKANPRLYSIAVDLRGQLWMGSYIGVYCQTRKGSIEYYGEKAGFPPAGVYAVACDAEGTVWAGTYQAGLFRRSGDRFIEYTPARELRRQVINRIYPSKSGELWVGASEGLYRINRSTESMQSWSTQNGLPSNWVTALAIDSLGRLWVGTSEGLAYLDHDRSHPVELPTADKTEVTALFAESHGMLWIGNAKGDIWRIVTDPRAQNGSQPEAMVKIREAEVRSSSSVTNGRRNALVTSFCEDTEGDIWIGSDAGLFRISDTRFKVYSSNQGLPRDFVNCVFPSRSGKIWLGTDGGLAFLSGPAAPRATLLQSVSPIVSEQITALYEDSHNILWVGTLTGSLQQFRPEPFSKVAEPVRFGPEIQVSAICEVPPEDVWVGTFGAGLHYFKNGRLVRSFAERDGITRDTVHTLALGPDHTLWIAVAQGLRTYRDGKLEDGLAKEEGSPIHDCVFESLAVDSDGTIWAGASGSGLARIRNGYAGRLCTMADGLFSDEFFTLLNDGRGYLWASSNRGIFATPMRELNAFFDGNQSKVNCRVFTIADGLPTAECVGGISNTSCRTRDGRLWFATVAGLAVTSRETLIADSRSPPIFLERLVANLTQSFLLGPSQPPAILSPDTHSIEIHYSGLSLATPESLQYRYRLVGFDPSWVDAGIRRVAYYTNLPPGNYEFHVITCNRDGIWSPENLAARLQFVVQPHFYQTWWFYIVCVGLVCLFIWGLYWWRLQQILQERARLARDLHDTLTQGLVGILRQTESAIQSEREGRPTETIQILERVSALARETLLEARGALKALRASILSKSNWLANVIAKVVKKGKAR